MLNPYSDLPSTYWIAIELIKAELDRSGYLPIWVLTLRYFMLPAAIEVI